MASVLDMEFLGCENQLFVGFSEENPLGGFATCRLHILYGHARFGHYCSTIIHRPVPTILEKCLNHQGRAGSMEFLGNAVYLQTHLYTNDLLIQLCISTKNVDI